MLTLQHLVRLVYSQISNPSKATILATTTVRLVKHVVSLLNVALRPRFRMPYRPFPLKNYCGSAEMKKFLAPGG